ncbi:hypothetical protein E2K80_15115 [Rhodophyticola sp. CCM32]|uniref:hypothetical protein n=1 Tax=Rhodophyticola sp. CCM32 TaxID=2916397 RepID=UPI00107F7258|nr:hypothetical protein [Rhodophyticola sp. CCM32]QBY01893.1 hypothetical protein E2K80_15115 [Rhodophyticola sp. CCM32]
MRDGLCGQSGAPARLLRILDWHRDGISRVTDGGVLDVQAGGISQGIAQFKQRDVGALSDQFFEEADMTPIYLTPFADPEGQDRHGLSGVSGPVDISPQHPAT